MLTLPNLEQEPWEKHPDIWKSQAAFFNYLRGSIRMIWSRYPAKLSWKKTQLVDPPPGYSGRAKKLGQCHYCKEMFAASHLEVDHVVAAGSCNSWETVLQFLQRLLDVNNNWVLACKTCHKVKSYAERMGIAFDSALLEKRVIAFMKKPKEEVLAFCQEHGYNANTLTNAEKRKQALTEIFAKEKT